MASYSYSSDYYEGDLCDYSSPSYHESSPFFPFHGSATYSVYEEDPGEEYPLSPYHNSYCSAPYQDSVAYGYNSTFYDHGDNPVEDHSLVPYYRGYNWNDAFAHDHVSYHHQPDGYSTHDAAASWSRISYSATALSEPKYITLYGESSVGNSVQTQFLVSYNVSDFNEPEYEEYDPTPYGGGYDIAATYGEPLSPSEETCYPRFDPSPVIPLAVPSPVAEEEHLPAHVQSAGEETSAEVLPPAVTDTQPQGKPGESNQREEEQLPEDEEKEKANGNGYEGNETTAANGSYDQFEKQVVPHQVPSGYGLEAVDICESLFGPWPCLTRNYRNAYNNQQDQEECGYGSYGNKWNDAADYLFGNSYPYGQTMPPENGGNVHAYQRHYYQEDPLHREVKYVLNSWSG